jgi:hypothetical protein
LETALGKDREQLISRTRVSEIRPNLQYPGGHEQRRKQQRDQSVYEKNAQHEFRQVSHHN